MIRRNFLAAVAAVPLVSAFGVGLAQAGVPYSTSGASIITTDGVTVIATATSSGVATNVVNNMNNNPAPASTYSVHNTKEVWRDSTGIVATANDTSDGKTAAQHAAGMVSVLNTNYNAAHSSPTYDWTSNFSSRSAFETDWYPAPDGGQGGIDPASGYWVAGTNNDFYPYSFYTDASAPAGEYVRVHCDKIALHQSDANKVGGSPWIGASGLTKRNWSSGYMEFSARFPSAGTGNGLWPALWMYANNKSGTITDHAGSFTQVPASRASTEIDLLEIFGGASGMAVNTGLHSQASDGSPYSNPPTATKIDTALNNQPTNKDTWHTWGIEWTPSVIHSYYDRVLVGTNTSVAGQFVNQPLQARIDYVIMAPNSFGTPADGSTPSALYMDVSFVRHYANRPF